MGCTTSQVQPHPRHAQASHVWVTETLVNPAAVLPKAGDDHQKASQMGRTGGPPKAPARGLPRLCLPEWPARLTSQTSSQKACDDTLVALVSPGLTTPVLTTPVLATPVLTTPDVISIPKQAIGFAEMVLPMGLQDKKFDHDLAMHIAKSLRDKDYSLAHFYRDSCEAFPELALYVVTHAPEEDGRQDSNRRSITSATTSGVSSNQEYLRTIGAMFAVYWLVRIGVDGEHGFSFGVDEVTWKPRPVPNLAPQPSSEEKDIDADPAWPGKPRAELEKRKDFYEKQDWEQLQNLLVVGGLLRQEGGTIVVEPERVLAMLCLTAFHDVMKLTALLPKVAEEHAPFMGYKAGETIADHDLALGYVLIHHADLLPSFGQLGHEENQRTIRFTQSKMQFNHGWLVQGEAPPAPLFANFKEVITTEGVKQADIAFYFTHWVTDLAGAEAAPLKGSEKLVLKFPHAVFDSFVQSFAVLNELAKSSETEVFEHYLVQAWAARPLAKIDGRDPPPGVDAVARMRLSLQAQTPDKQAAVEEVWKGLSSADRKVLSYEMARSGIEGQFYEHAPAFPVASGPAFLVYYSPALVRNLVASEALGTLRILAEVYRAARRLFPLQPTSGSRHTVTVRIDQLKDAKFDNLMGATSEGRAWVLVRQSDVDAHVENLAREELEDMNLTSKPARKLDLWGRCMCASTENLARGEPEVVNWKGKPVTTLDLCGRCLEQVDTHIDEAFEAEKVRGPSKTVDPKDQLVDPGFKKELFSLQKVKGIERVSSCWFPTSWVAVRIMAVRDYNHNSSVYTFELPFGQQLNLPVCACLLLRAPGRGRIENGGAADWDPTQDAVRPYTPIADLPGKFELLVKRYENGAASQWLHGLSVGDEVDFKHIKFNVKRQYPFPGKKTITMLTGGTGITPMYQVLSKLMDTEGDDREVVLLLGNNTPEDILLKEELLLFKRRNPARLKLVFLVGKTLDAPRPTGWEDNAEYVAETGWINETLIRQHAFPPSPDTLVFVCGVLELYDAVCGPREEDFLLEGSVLERLGYTIDMVQKH